ncbi:MAG TPA: hypothetical protein VNT75_05235 [Symbiobacteriaceae bacterium]|nr:hypothetical protein [Symbiobacteriaceae bacterium]
MDIKYDDSVIIHVLEEEARRRLGTDRWNELISGLELPSLEMDRARASVVTRQLMERFDTVLDSETSKDILSNVRHGLTHASFPGVREMFLRYGRIDEFAAAVRQEYLDDMARFRAENRPWYGIWIDDTILDFVRNDPYQFYGARVGSDIYARAIPYRVAEYLKETDARRKRYMACHCPFARESILQDQGPVSPTLCYCSLGHTKVMWEVALDTPLDGEVVESALAGDLSCLFVIHLPDDVMERYAL